MRGTFCKRVVIVTCYKGWQDLRTEEQGRGSSLGDARYHAGLSPGVLAQQQIKGLSVKMT